jgi:hypothetical protein
MNIDEGVLDDITTGVAQSKGTSRTSTFIPGLNKVNNPLGCLKGKVETMLVFSRLQLLGT